MRKIVFFLSCLLIGFIHLSSKAQVKVKVWADEFDYNGLPDPNRWGYDVGGNGWGNNELQYYTENRLENARVENGKLIIEARKEPWGNNEYTSARLVTRNKGDWKYGRIEAMARLPHGRGTWPAIWMLPTNWVYGAWPKSGEIDIMEYVGYDPGVVHGSIHTEAYNHVMGTQKTDTTLVPDAETTYHLYAIEWDADKIDFYVDNRIYFTFLNEHKDYKTWPFDQAFHLLLNIAVGGNWGGAQGIDPNIWPQKMWVEYVRVYQYIPLSDIKISGPSHASPNEEGLIFSLPDIDGASFNWTVPQDASMINGQGTKQIQVNWGTQPGKVKCEVIHPQAGGTYEKDVSVSTIPTGNIFRLTDFEQNGTQGWEVFPGQGNQITLQKQDSLLLLKYQINAPLQNPYVEYRFASAINMSEHQHFNVFMKTFNLSQSVISRIDLFDTQGRLTDVTPVFTITPREPHGIFQHYHFDFTNQWGSNTPQYGSQTDNTQVAGFRMYVDYGLFGRPGSDSLWLRNLTISRENYLGIPDGKPTHLFSIKPNPARNRLNLYSDMKEAFSARIFNLTGEVVTEVLILPGDNSLAINNLKPGIYFIVAEKYNFTQKFIKIQ
ncbi:MAG: family 16 glycosylhydrolase [Bacteroidales bacterium]|jgi:beta-glucanase (GH16 family)|nr:family 16 glycosylhydrolase [Bacteroidales bacterium]